MLRIIRLIRTWKLPAAMIIGVLLYYLFLLASFNSKSTHYLISSLRRTEKFLGSLAQGNWILDIKYITACKKKRRWLDEEEFEWHQGDHQDISDEICPYWRKRHGHAFSSFMYVVTTTIVRTIESTSMIRISKPPATF